MFAYTGAFLCSGYLKLASFKGNQRPHCSNAASHVGAAVLAHVARSGRSDAFHRWKKLKEKSNRRFNVATFRNSLSIYEKRIKKEEILSPWYRKVAQLNSQQLLSLDSKSIRDPNHLGMVGTLDLKGFSTLKGFGPMTTSTMQSYIYAFF